MPLGKGLGAFFTIHPASPTAQTTTASKDSVFADIKDVQNTSLRTGESVYQIPLTSIHPNPAQPRRQFDDDEMQELASSIKEHGIVQPIVVAEKKDGMYEIVAGERRFRAAKMIGLATVPALVRHMDDRRKLETALIENIQRADLNAIEEACAYKRLSSEFHETQEEIAKRVGKSRAHVANIIRLLDLPQDIQAGIIDGAITHTKARALLGLPTIAAQLKAYFNILGNKTMTTRETELMVRHDRRGGGRRDPLFDAIENRLRGRFGTKVYVVGTPSRGSVKIEFYSEEEFKKMLDILEGR